MPDESIEKYRPMVADNFGNDIKEQIADIYKESMHDAKDDPTDQNGAGRISKTIAKACTLMARLSADQAVQMEQQTKNTNILNAQTDELIEESQNLAKFNTRILWLTVALFACTAVQLGLFAYDMWYRMHHKM